MHPRPWAPVLSPALLLLALLLAGLLPAACSSEHIEPDEPKSAATREFRKTHIECTPHFYRIPCQIGPDGRLYQYNPDEVEARRKN